MLHCSTNFKDLWKYYFVAQRLEANSQIEVDSSASCVAPCQQGKISAILFETLICSRDMRIAIFVKKGDGNSRRLTNHPKPGGTPPPHEIVMVNQF